MIAPEAKKTRKVKQVPLKSGSFTDPQFATGGPTDWSTLLSVPGLPPAVVSQLQKITAATPPQFAVSTALHYIRGTPWYAATYPGIQHGINTGLFNDESGYRQYQAQLTQLYKQYNNRAPTQHEIAQQIVAGKNPTQIAEQFSGAAYITANQPEIQQTAGAFGDTGALTKPELTALGNEQAGIDTPLGQLIQKRLQKAQQRMQGAFKGVLASPAMSLAGGRLAGAAPPPDVGA